MTRSGAPAYLLRRNKVCRRAASVTRNGMPTQTNTDLSEVPVAPGRWPLLGNTPALLRRRCGFTASLGKHGDLVKILLGPLSTYLVTSAELVHEVLVTKASAFERGILFDRFRPYFGNGIGVSAGDVHRRQRRLVQPAFHRERIATYTATMARLATGLATSWRAGEIVEVDKAMQGLATAIIGQTLFSTELGAAAIAEARQSMPIVIKQGMVRALSPAVIAKLPVPSNRRFDLAIARLRQIVREVIAAGRAQGTDHGDVLSMLLMARDDAGKGMTDQQVYDEVVSLLTGGIETVGLALSWFFHEIGRDPLIEQRLHAEVDTVLAGRAITTADVPGLEYTQHIAREVLRRYPIWLLMRRTRSEVELGGVRIPPGTEITFSPHALHHDPRYFAEPNRFDPDRWSPELSATLPKGAYIPFSAGPHQCIANLFALNAIVVVAATIAARWRLVPDTRKPVRIKVTGAAYPNRLPMIAQPRF